MNKFCFIVLIFFIVVLQTGFHFEYISQLVPDISLLLLLLYSLNRKNKEEATAVSIGVGLFQDLLVGRALGVYALSKLLVIYWTGKLGEKELMEDNIPAVFVILIMANIVYWVLLWIIFSLGFQMDIIFYKYLYDHIFIQSVFAGVLGVFLYPRVKKIVKKRGHLFPFK